MGSRPRFELDKFPSPGIEAIRGTPRKLPTSRRYRATRPIDRPNLAAYSRICERTNTKRRQHQSTPAVQRRAGGRVSRGQESASTNTDQCRSGGPSPEKARTQRGRGANPPGCHAPPDHASWHVPRCHWRPRRPAQGNQDLDHHRDIALRDWARGLHRRPPLRWRALHVPDGTIGHG
jgi:hypothetical protein